MSDSENKKKNKPDGQVGLSCTKDSYKDFWEFGRVVSMSLDDLLAFSDEEVILLTAASIVRQLEN